MGRPKALTMTGQDTAVRATSACAQGEVGGTQRSAHVETDPAGNSHNSHCVVQSCISFIKKVTKFKQHLSHTASF